MTKDITTTEDTPWLTLIGITPEGQAALGPSALKALSESRHLYGSARQLALIEEGATPKASRHPWPSPMMPTVHKLCEEKPTQTVMLASGDPLCWGIGQHLANALSMNELKIIPATPVTSLISAALGWPSAEVKSLSLCSQPLAALAAHLTPGARLILLPATPADISEIGHYLAAKGYGQSPVTILENLGSDAARIRQATAAELSAMADCAPLTSLALTLKHDGQSPRLTSLPGLPDEAFEHDGQMTRATMRAVTLAALRPGEGEHLWDIGAGSGSISIEWLRAANRTTATAIEQNSERAARALRNAETLGVRQRFELIEGTAPDALTGLAPPDAIFIGGGITAPGLLETALTALKPAGRLVANSVTIEGEALLISAYKTHGGRLQRIAMEEADPVGRFHGWRPKMPISQWIYHKPA